VIQFALQKSWAAHCLSWVRIDVCAALAGCPAIDCPQRRIHVRFFGDGSEWHSTIWAASIHIGVWRCICRFAARSARARIDPAVRRRYARRGGRRRIRRTLEVACVQFIRAVGGGPGSAARRKTTRHCPTMPSVPDDRDVERTSSAGWDGGDWASKTRGVLQEGEFSPIYAK